MPIAKRQIILRQLAAMPNEAGWPVLGRLVVQDPSRPVRWVGVSLLCDASRIAAAAKTTQAVLKETLADADRVARDAPLIALGGHALAIANPDAAAPLLRRAIDLEKPLAATVARPPTPPRLPDDRTEPQEDPDPDAATEGVAPEIRLVFADLVALRLRQGHPQAAADLLREQYALAIATGASAPALADGAARRIASSGTPAQPAEILRSLLTLHAKAGPLDGLAGDIASAAQLGAEAARPDLIYALSQVRARQGHAWTSRTLGAAAYASGYFAPLKRLDTGNFLIDAGWSAAAEAEFGAILHDPYSSPPALGRAHFGMAEVERRRDEPLARAEHLRAALEIADRYALNLSTTDSAFGVGVRRYVEIWMNGSYLDDALARNDAERVSKFANALLALGPDAPLPPDVSMSLVTGLKGSGRADDAARVFAPLYAERVARLKASPQSIDAMNDMAWLCARCDERLDEARTLIEQAHQAAPANAAILDTAAEVQFRLGHPDEATRLEKQAMALRPEDPVLRHQMARFSAAPSARPPSSPPPTSRPRE